MTIRGRIIWAVLPVVAVVNLLYAFYAINAERGRALAQLRRDAVEAARLLRVVTAGPLYDGDVERLNATLDSFFSDPNMAELVLEEREGDIRLSRRRAAAGGERISQTVTIDRAGDELGRVTSVYSTALIEGRLAESRNRVLLLSALMAVGLALVMYYVARGIAAPIGRLTLAARSMADGHLEQPIETSGAEEVASLAMSFARMRDAVRAQMADLADKNARLREEMEQREALESRLVQAQKMEAVGRLAGGIAHDFNNLLTVINGVSEMLLERVGPDHELRADVEAIRQSGESAARLTRQLLAFSRKQVFQPKRLDVNALVANLERMLRRVIGEDVQLVCRPQPDLWPVRADPGQMEQVLLNLAVNARDAMPVGGRLTIETANATLDESHRQRDADVRPGPYVVIAVSDTGRGMDPDTAARVFEPFFTTKGTLGTGLGLSTVYGVVKQSGGHIWLYSEPGHGTTFKIYLPRDEEAPPVEEPQPEATTASGGGETVLVVEDSDRVGDFIEQVLTRHGYLVLRARDGGEAVGLAERHPGAIDLLLTDVVLPGGSGRESADRILARRPETARLFISGYTADAIVRHGVLEPGLNFLEKPFTPSALVQKVTEVLGRRPPRRPPA
jgi:signal transduction histidine kinase/ActR/RegA family two-component response regulator